MFATSFHKQPKIDSPTSASLQSHCSFFFRNFVSDEPNSRRFLHKMLWEIFSGFHFRSIPEIYPWFCNSNFSAGINLVSFLFQFSFCHTFLNFEKVHIISNMNLNLNFLTPPCFVFFCLLFVISVICFKQRVYSSTCLLPFFIYTHKCKNHPASSNMKFEQTRVFLGPLEPS